MEEDSGRLATSPAFKASKPVPSGSREQQGAPSACPSLGGTLGLGKESRPQVAGQQRWPLLSQARPSHGQCQGRCSTTHGQAKGLQDRQAPWAEMDPDREGGSTAPPILLNFVKAP